MAQLRRRMLSGAAIIAVSAFLAQGCSRPVAFGSNDDARRPANVPPDDGSHISQDAPKPVSTLLPGPSQSLPTGTLLTVRLQDPVWTDAPGATGTFTAVVDDPVTVDGATLIPRGAHVSGRVESAGASTIKTNRNYVRLTLDSINLDGHDFPIQTSSLFARGRASISAAYQPGDSLAVIHLDKGRRLTFRLTEPVYVASQRPLPTP